MVAPCSICFTINKDRLPAKKAESRSVIFLQQHKCFQKEDFCEFCEFSIDIRVRIW